MWRRIDQRVDEMVAAGLEDEVRRLLTSGISPKCTAMQAIGYKEFTQALSGDDLAGGSRCGKAALPPVCQAAAHLVWPQPQHPLGAVGRSPGI